MSHELFLTRRQAIKIRNLLANNRSTNIKFSKSQISKIIKSDRSFDSWLGDLEKKALTNIAIPIVGDNLAVLVSNLA